MLRALRELKLKRSGGLKACDGDPAAGAVPEEFKCSLSMELMRDPVIIASGQQICGHLIGHSFREMVKSKEQNMPSNSTSSLPHHSYPESLDPGHGRAMVQKPRHQAAGFY